MAFGFRADRAHSILTFGMNFETVLSEIEETVETISMEKTAYVLQLS